MMTKSREINWEAISAEPTFDLMGRRCLAECLAEKYNLDPEKTFRHIENMNSMERNEYLSALKKSADL